MKKRLISFIAAVVLLIGIAAVSVRYYLFVSQTIYRKRRKAPAFRHGDISHTLFPRKDTFYGLH